MSVVLSPQNTQAIAYFVLTRLEEDPHNAILGTFHLAGIGKVLLFSDTEARKTYNEVMEKPLSNCGQFSTEIDVGEGSQAVYESVEVIWGAK